MFSRGLLLTSGAQSVKQTIGEAGEVGFGVGCYGGNPADLRAMGLTPMLGFDKPAHANYGNYQHTNGSVMVFVPAFCYRLGNVAAPSYSRDKENAVEIRDAAMGEGDGWILHRAFIDGGVQKAGFFIDKYFCSKSPKDQNIAVSVKNADQISLTTRDSYASSATMTGCVGKILDAITLCKARGFHYSCVTAFQYSALSMLSLAHGQAAKSATWCAWYDATYTKNYPKGCNNNRSDVDEPSLTWADHGKHPEYDKLGKTGSCSVFAKSTHNGQESGVADVNGCMYVPLIGVTFSSPKTTLVMKESIAAHSITQNNYSMQSNYDSVSVIDFSSLSMLSWGSNAFFSDDFGAKRALTGVIPREYGEAAWELFGQDTLYTNGHRLQSECVMYGCGHSAGRGSLSGIWARACYNTWSEESSSVGVRAAGYAN